MGKAGAEGEGELGVAAGAGVGGRTSWGARAMEGASRCRGADGDEMIKAIEHSFASAPRRVLRCWLRGIFSSLSLPSVRNEDTAFHQQPRRRPINLSPLCSSRNEAQEGPPITPGKITSSRCSN